MKSEDVNDVRCDLEGGGEVATETEVVVGSFLRGVAGTVCKLIPSPMSLGSVEREENVGIGSGLGALVACASAGFGEERGELDPADNDGEPPSEGDLECDRLAL